MNRIKLICLSLAVVAGTGATASAEPFATDINPAYRYYQAFIVAPDFATEERDFLFAKEWRGEKLPERFGELVARYDTEFKLVREAAKATVPCDWGLDLGQGPYTLLPHLGRGKGVAQAARLRVMWDLQQGRQADACAD